MAIQIHFSTKRITVQGAGGKKKTLNVKGGQPAVATVISKIVWKYIAKGSLHIEIRRAGEGIYSTKESLEGKGKDK